MATRKILQHVGTFHSKSQQSRLFSSFSGRFTVGSSQAEKMFPSKKPLPKDLTGEVEPGNLWKLAKEGEQLGQKLDKEGYENLKQRTAARVTGGISESLVEAQIKAAMDQDNCSELPYAGKPLPGTFDETGSVLTSDEEFLYKLLKRNDTAPEWVESNKRLFSDMKEMRNLLKEGFVKYQLKPQPKVEEKPVEIQSPGLFSSFFRWMFPKPQTSSNTTITSNGEVYERKFVNGIWVMKKILSPWESVVEDTEERIKKINKEIELYNSMVPYYFQLVPLEMENEMKEMKSEVESALKEMKEKKDQVSK